MSRFETIRPTHIKKEFRTLPLRHKVGFFLATSLPLSFMGAQALDQVGLLPEAAPEMNYSGCQAGKQESETGCVWTEEEMAKQRERMLKAEEKAKCVSLGASEVAAFKSIEERINEAIAAKSDSDSYQWQSPTPAREGFSNQTIYKVSEAEKVDSETTGNPRQLTIQLAADSESSETDWANYGVLFYPKEDCFKLHEGSSNWDGVFQNIVDKFEPVENTAELTRALQPFENIVSELENS